MSAPPLLVIVLVDALGWDRAGAHDFLGKELPHRKPLDTILGFSSGAIPALLSGTWPSENGHWVMFHRSPATSPFGAARLLAWAPARVRKSWRVRQWVKRRAARAVRGYFSLYEVPWTDLPALDVCERANLFAPGGLGRIGTIFDDLAERRLVTRVWDWRTDEAANERAFVAAATQAARPGGGAPDVLFFYTPAMDEVMHAHGVMSPAADARLAQIERAVSAALAAARSAGREAWCYLTSDHGMTDVTFHVDVMAAVRETGLRPGFDYDVFYDSTLARFWFRSPEAEPRIEAALAPLKGRFLTREDEQRFGILFADRRYGDRIFLVDEGGLIVPSYMGSLPVKAMHGYDPAVPSSRAILLANRPLPPALSHVVDFRAFFAAELDQRAAAAESPAWAGAGA